ncbi:MAG: hypothetical protein ACNA8K_04055 [Cyclonatronaceae bacterium]
MATPYKYGYGEDPDSGSEFVVREPYAVWDLSTATRQKNSRPAGTSCPTQKRVRWRVTSGWHPAGRS